MASPMSLKASFRTISHQLYPHTATFRKDLKNMENYLDRMISSSRDPDQLASVLDVVRNLATFEPRACDYEAPVEVIQDVQNLLHLRRDLRWLGVDADNLAHSPIEDAISKCTMVIYDIVEAEAQTKDVDVVKELESASLVLPRDLKYLFEPALKKASSKIGKTKSKLNVWADLPSRAEQREDVSQSIGTSNPPPPIRKRSSEHLRLTDQDEGEDQSVDKENSPPPRKRRRYSVQPSAANLKPGHELYKKWTPDGVRTISLPTQGRVPPPGMRPLPPIVPGSAVPRTLTRKSYMEKLRREISSPEGSILHGLDIPKGHRSRPSGAEAQPETDSDIAEVTRTSRNSAAHQGLIDPNNGLSCRTGAKIVQIPGLLNHPSSSSTSIPPMDVFEDDTATFHTKESTGYPSFANAVTSSPMSETGRRSLDGFAAPFGTDSAQYLPSSFTPTEASSGANQSSRTLSDHKHRPLNLLPVPVSPSSPFQGRAEPAKSLVDINGNDGLDESEDDADGLETVAELKAELGRLRRILCNMRQVLGP